MKRVKTLEDRFRHACPKHKGDLVNLKDLEDRLEKLEADVDRTTKGKTTGTEQAKLSDP